MTAAMRPGGQVSGETWVYWRPHGHTGQRARLPLRLVNEVVRGASRYAVSHTSIHRYLMKIAFRGHLMTLVK